MRFLQQTGDRGLPGFSLTRYLRNIDWILLAAAAGLVTLGVAMIYSTTSRDPGLSSPGAYVQSQLVGLALGALAMVAISLVDFSWLPRWQRYLYAANLAFLLVTLVIGDERMGARRWIDLRIFDLQTSELAKVLLIVCFGAFLMEGVELRHRFRFVVLGVVYVAVPSAIIFMQPDLGTALVFLVILLSMLLVWGIRWLHLAALLAAGGVAVVAVLRVLPATFGIHLLKPYQLQRLVVFLDPERDPTGPGYQLLQSKIAIASGLVTGKGYGEGTQTGLNFLPAHHTDFIFSVIGEELGFLGATLLLGLYLIVLWRAFRIASISKNLYGSLLAAGVIGALLFQVFVNLGMTIGIMPITGVPLPFVSFGSSSLVVFLMAVGLLESVHIHSRTALYGGRFKGEPYGQMAT
jgi:rod shape determining protein RodA